MISKLKPTTWEYIVHTQDNDGNTLCLKSIGKFSAPSEAKTYISENGKDWQFFGDFEICDKSKTARNAILEMWNQNKGGN